MPSDPPFATDRAVTSTKRTRSRRGALHRRWPGLVAYGKVMESRPTPGAIDARQGPGIADFPAHVGHTTPEGRNRPCWCGSGRKFKHCHGDPTARASAPSEASGGLGNGAENVESSAERRSRLYRWRNTARKLVEGSGLNHRVAHCGHTFAYGEDAATLYYSATRARARVGGTQTCANPWGCPVCASRISEQRRAELSKAMKLTRPTRESAEAGALIYHPYLVTLTASHRADESLADVLARVQGAWRTLTQRPAWRGWKESAGVEMYARALEVTHGAASGWHPHYHVLVLCHSYVTKDRRLALEDELYDLWSSALAANSGHCNRENGVNLAAQDRARLYVAKWGLEHEITKGAVSKTGRRSGRTILQLLAAADRGDETAGALYLEAIQALKGQHQLEFTPRLRELIAMVPDAEAADEGAQDDVVVARIDRDTWYLLRNRPDLITSLLESVEAARGSPDSYAEWDAAHIVRKRINLDDY